MAHIHLLTWPKDWNEADKIVNKTKSHTLFVKNAATVRYTALNR